MDKEKGISRRSFIKGVGGVAAAAAILGSVKVKAEPIPPFITPPKETLLEMYRRMQRIRQGELRLKKAFDAGEERVFSTLWYGTGHPSLGEEATNVGVAMAMEKGDLLTGSHRSHGYPLALGQDLNSWMAELMGRVTGSNRGHGGSMHIAYPDIGCLAMTGLVGSGVPHSLGVAKAFKLMGMKNVSVSTCGDAAMGTSGFGATPNVAAIWNVPLVMVINNNQWGIGVPARVHNSCVKAGRDIATRAVGFEIPGITVDGNDIFAVYKAAKWCMGRAREGKGPSLLECLTFRQRAHGSSLPEHECTRPPYNNRAELEYWLRRDPIPRFESVVLGGLLAEEELAKVRKEVASEVEAAIEFGIKSPYPNPEEEFKYFRDYFKA